jgi:hypothetical protein
MANNMLTLFEITNGWMGESYCRSYVWAEDEAAAFALFETMYPGDESNSMTIQPLFRADAAPFCTKLSDSGWEMPRDITQERGVLSVNFPRQTA